MKLVERHILTKSNPQWKTIDHLCFLSKNLFNYSLYRIKQVFEETGKYYDYNKLDHELKTQNHSAYRNLPNHTSQQILLVQHRNCKSFFALLKKWKKDKKSLTGCPELPYYKHKTKGRNLIVFTTNQAVIKDGYIHFPKKVNLQPIKTKVDNLQQVRIIPQSTCYVVEVVYNKEITKHENLNENNYLSIDLGVNNLAGVTTNQPGLKPFLINGKIIKSINQYYNKKKAELQSSLEKNHKLYKSKRLDRLTHKRNNKINDYLHKTSHFIIEYCIEINIKNIVIGKNKNWKVECNMGKVNNQNFVSIPFEKLINQIAYKAELNSINVIIHEESYTSKCSSLDKEPVCKHDKYIGKRIKRGLFKYSNGLINADINSSLNILRKVIGDGFLNPLKSLSNRGFVLNPVLTTSV